jgi:hypothetical protein
MHPPSIKRCAFVAAVAFGFCCVFTAANFCDNTVVSVLLLAFLVWMVLLFLLLMLGVLLVGLDDTGTHRPAVASQENPAGAAPRGRKKIPSSFGSGFNFASMQPSSVKRCVFAVAAAFGFGRCVFVAAAFCDSTAVLLALLICFLLLLLLLLDGALVGFCFVLGLLSDNASICIGTHRLVTAS